MIFLLLGAFIGVCGAAGWGVRAACAAAPQELPSVRLVTKPADGSAERRAHPQPTAPEGAKEVPFVETAPESVLTEQEKHRGYVLFQRALTEPAAGRSGALNQYTDKETIDAYSYDHIIFTCCISAHCRYRPGP